MYKVFFSDITVYLTNDETFHKTLKQVIFFKYDQKDQLVEMIDLCEIMKKTRNVVLYHSNLKVLWDDFVSFFIIIEAAGGIVKNEKNEILVIKRKGFWDLPKGKCENNEEIELCAIREVTEECGLQKIKIKNKITETFHTYKINNDRILKRTHWYGMLSSSTENLIPQSLEGITDVKWISLKGMDEIYKNTYESIRQLLKTAN